MRVFINIEYRPSEETAGSTIYVGPNRMRSEYSAKRVDERLEIRVNPQIDENEAALVALIQALDTSDELMIGLGQLVEAAFLTGVDIGKKHI